MKTPVLAALSVLIVTGLTGPVAAAQDQIVGPAVLTRLLSEPSVRVFVYLSVPEAPGGRAEATPQGIRVPDAARRAEVARAQDRFLSAMETAHFTLGRRFQSIPALAGEITAEGIRRLARVSGVLRLDVDEPVRAHLGQSVPLINADDLHAIGYTGEGVTLAILDTGIDTDHPDLTDDLDGEACFCTGGCCPNGQDTQLGPGAGEDETGHGSNVGGIITSGGVAAPEGVAPDAMLVVIRVLDANGQSCCSSDVVAGLDWILTNRPDVDVINMSLGSFALFSGDCDTAAGFTMAYATAINALRANGVTTFVSSGNDASGTQMSAPACISSALSVGAVYDSNGGGFSFSNCTDPTRFIDQVTCYSNSNATTDLFAPGSPIRSDFLSGGTATFHGTSMASPHAAGCAADLLEAVPTLTPDTIEENLEATGVPVTDTTNGLIFPRIDCLGALSRMLGCIDVDEDGYGSPGVSTCSNGAAEDCNNLDPAIFPGSPELCDSVDNDCDGLIDDEVDAPPRRLTNDPVADRSPAVAERDDGSLFMARDRGNVIVFSTSSNGGTTWSAPQTVPTTDTDINSDPTLAAGAGDTIHLVFRSDRTGNSDLFYMRTDDGGGSWSTPLNLTPGDAADDLAPSIALRTGGDLWVAYHRTPGEGIRYISSLDGGGTWSAPDILPSGGAASHPGLTGSADGCVWIAYWTGSEVAFQKSCNGGSTWSTRHAIDFAFDTEVAPAILEAAGGRMWVVWAATSTANRDVLFSVSANGGTTWNVPVRITFDAAPDSLPALSRNGSGIFIAYESARDGNDEMYATRAFNSPVCVCDPPVLELCDGLDNDCDGLPGGDEVDRDLDGVRICAGDCNDSSALARPGLPEQCDGLDNDCDGFVDEGFDQDADGFADCFDNCPSAFNPTQDDADGDGLGDLCDACPLDPANDEDSDGLCAGADNCPTVPNPAQGDVDSDMEGNRCDLDDGLILIDLPDATQVTWQEEATFLAFNLYRGNLSALVDGDGDGAADGYGACLVREIDGTSQTDPGTPPVGDGYIYLLTGLNPSGESSFGSASNGASRPNTSPCPSSFANPPVFESVNIGQTERTIGCDFTDAWNWGLPNALGSNLQVSPGPLLLGGTYTEVRLEALVTDADSLPGESDILEVVTRFTPAGSGLETSLQMLDDGSSTTTGTFFQQGMVPEGCVVDPVLGLQCQAAIYPLNSNDAVTGDDLFTRTIALFNLATAGPGAAFLQDCIALDTQQDLFLPTPGVSFTFSFEARDLAETTVVWPATPGAAAGTNVFQCSGDECLCCFLEHNVFSGPCGGLPGLIGSDAPAGACNTF